MAALGLGLLALVVTGATGLSIYHNTCETLPSENWDDHIASRLPQPPLRGHATYDHVIVLPAHKLAFCWIQKVASEHFGPLFNQLNSVPRETAGEIAAFLEPYPSNLTRQNVPLSSISRENGWKFALFSRDPMERYLSAFMSKCVPTGGNTWPVQCGIGCCGPTTRAKPDPTEEVVSLFEERAAFDAKHGLPGVNAHWRSQTSIIADRCNLPGVNWFDAEQVDYVGHVTRDTAEVNEQVQEMLQRLTGVQNVPGVVSQHFPRRSSLLQCPEAHCTKASEHFNLFYRKNSTVRAVMKLMADDYGNHAKLHLPPREAARGLALAGLAGQQPVAGIVG